jgi:hypothetical protein
MPDADKLDRLLVEAGDRWRAVQPGPPAIDTVWRRPAGSWSPRSGLLAVAAALVVTLTAIAIGGGGRPAPLPMPVPLVTKYLASASPTPTVPSFCPVTLHPDARPLASQTAGLSLPGFLVPYGRPDLWTTIPTSGSWATNTSMTGGRFIRTFWYSDRWSMTDEPSPSISVSAGRLGGGDSVTGSAAVNARSRELGDSMIVSLDLPSGGCWQITGTYRDQSLSYVVWIERDTSTMIVSDATDLPGDVDGVPVTGVQDTATALARTQPGQSILVGGWLTAPVVMSCPAMQTFPDIWNVCSAIRVSEGPWGGDVEAVYKGTLNPALPTIPDGQVEPVVLRVHANDPACPFGADCSSTAVIDGIAWLGRVGPPPPPTNTAPPDGISRADAIRDAIGNSFNTGGSLNPTVVSAVAGHYAELGPPGSTDVAGDRWVWAVTLFGFFRAPDCATGVPCHDTGSSRLVVLDYVTGELLIEETPAPVR